MKRWINLILIAFFVQFGDVVVNLDNIIYMKQTQDNKTEMVYGISIRSSGVVGIKSNKSIVVDMPLKTVEEVIRKTHVEALGFGSWLGAIDKAFREKSNDARE